jgi:hypothetical protein
LLSSLKLLIVLVDDFDSEVQQPIEVLSSQPFLLIEHRLELIAEWKLLNWLLALSNSAPSGH